MTTQDISDAAEFAADTILECYGDALPATEAWIFAKEYAEDQEDLPDLPEEMPDSFPALYQIAIDKSSGTHAD